MGESYKFLLQKPAPIISASWAMTIPQQGLCQIEINSTAPEQTLTLEEGFGALDTTTTCPTPANTTWAANPSCMTTALISPMALSSGWRRRPTPDLDLGFGAQMGD